MKYLILKWIHILSSTVLFGTGVGLAFFFFSAHRGSDLGAIRFVTSLVVKGDFLFTTPAGLVQIISGLGLIWFLGLSLTEIWLLAALGLFAFAGACWLPVVWIQIRMRDMAMTADAIENLPSRYWRLHAWWVLLGALAFPALVVVFGLMVFRPGG